jgi:CRISPR-associated exonuclease Cas4
MMELTVTDVKQWSYCRRIVYFAHVMQSCGQATFKMQEARRAEEMFEKLEVRRTLAKYRLEEARRRFGFWLRDQELGLAGKADLLLEAKDQIAVVDFKLTGSEPGENHRSQLTAYLVMAERAFGLPAQRGFIYRIPDGRLYEYAVEERDRQQLYWSVRQMREVCQEQIMPEATEVRQRCEECEYQNYCADVW